MNETDIEIGIFTKRRILRSIEIKSAKKFRKWGIGKKGINNGILISVASKNRKLRVTTGYGMEWIITDSDASTIINSIVADFQKKEYFEGFKSALESIENENFDVEWKIQQKSLDLVSAEDTGKIFLIPKTSIKNIEKARGKLTFEIENKKWDLIYTKHMDELVPKILEDDYTKIYIRMNDYKKNELLLLGVE